jgi:hypothetical protein
MITRKDLKAINACPAGQDAFSSAFPNGAENWLDVANHEECEPSWRGFIAANSPGLTLAERESLADRSNDPAYWRGYIATRAPGLTLAERESLADRSNDPAYWRGYIATRAPGLTFAERESLADRSDSPAYWRGQIAANYNPKKKE